MRLLYLHGFRSSPLSTKAQTMARRVAAYNVAAPLEQRIDWYCPQLPPSPAQAMDELMRWAQASKGASQHLAVIGSSLGGFYAALLAQATGCRCVLLNPAVYPARDLAAYIGRVTNWHSQGDFDLTQQHVDELRALETTVFSYPERTMAIISKGDEVLDWREMTTRYPAAHMKLLEGSDHAISEFDDFADEVLAFVLRA
jgi:uncharacterized protein